MATLFRVNNIAHSDIRGTSIGIEIPPQEKMEKAVKMGHLNLIRKGSVLH